MTKMKWNVAKRNGVMKNDMEMMENDMERYEMMKPDMERYGMMKDDMERYGVMKNDME
ncbi:hypothetical protein RirG_156720 [Rhizophagus irregularis DAOM 197198w]|uniref:Uncharacterized protein n=1 Tax=Rhizophagus irregularis (strain DAOM 197198w) TaxID=1432141 RepID=A0A015KSU7_RHIIW|nr:hypothetical protein RirG_156720 [Rhizophagus irregularis DAOM 197198w]